MQVELIAEAMEGGRVENGGKGKALGVEKGTTGGREARRRRE
jgi:hypothetical protein